MMGETLRQLLETLDDPRRDAILAIYDKYSDLSHQATGGNNHQKWAGGYADHIAECIRVNRLTYPALDSFRKLPFSSASADICLFLHDIEKPFRYGMPGHPDVDYWGEKHAQLMGVYAVSDLEDPAPHLWEMLKDGILADLEVRFGFHLTASEMNALQYTHGEGSDHRKDRRVAGPLAAHVHHCDNTSARIWFDDGKGLS